MKSQLILCLKKGLRGLKNQKPMLLKCQMLQVKLSASWTTRNFWTSSSTGPTQTRTRGVNNYMKLKKFLRLDVFHQIVFQQLVIHKSFFYHFFPNPAGALEKLQKIAGDKTPEKMQETKLQKKYRRQNSRKNTGDKDLNYETLSTLCLLQVYRKLENDKKHTFLLQLKANGLTNLKWFGQYAETRSEDTSSKQEVLEGWFTGSFVALLRYVFLPLKNIACFPPRILSQVKLVP